MRVPEKNQRVVLVKEWDNVPPLWVEEAEAEEEEEEKSRYQLRHSCPRASASLEERLTGLSNCLLGSGLEPFQNR